jgi:precorrin-6y C5,15-methyltransferase (decarboxylating) CbiE subunit
VEPVYVVGIGPGSREYLLPAAAEAIEKADILVGARRHLEEFAPPEGPEGQKTILIEESFTSCLDEIDRRRRSATVAVLVSGDPCLFSYLGLLVKRIPREQLRIIPGISSVQLLAARAGVLLNNAVMGSVHGRPLEELREAVTAGRTVALLTDHEHTPPVIARYLLDNGASGITVWVGRDLSYPEESVEKFSLEELSQKEDGGKALCVLILKQTKKFSME